MHSILIPGFLLHKNVWFIFFPAQAQNQVLNRLTETNRNFERGDVDLCLVRNLDPYWFF